MWKEAAQSSTASLQRGKNAATPNKCPGYDNKHSDCEAPVLEPWVIWSASSLLLFPGSLWSEMVAPDRVLFIGQIELLDI